MKLERTKNTIRNSKWGAVQTVTSILLPFVVRTVLIHTLSAQYAGLSSLFTSVLQVLSLTELGFSNAIVYSMYKPVAEDDKTKICALLNLYKKTYRIIGTIILILGIIITPFLPYSISGDVPADTNLFVLYLIYLVNTVISYFLFAYKTSLLSAFQREDIASRNRLIINIILNAAQCILLLLFRNYYVFALVIPLTTLLLNILNSRSVDRYFPEYKPAGDISSEEKQELKKNVIGLMIWKIGGATRNTFDSIVVSAYLGLLLVAMYNNYFYIISGVNTFLSVISTSMIAGVGNKMATESAEENYKDFKKFQFYYMWIASWCTICMMCLYQPFMKVWMGEKLMLPNTVMFLFCYYFIMMKQGDINSIYYQAAGLWWHGKLRSIVEAVLNLSLNLILGRLWGITGILLATIISYTCVYFYGSKFVFTEYFKNGMLVRFYISNIITLIITGGIGFGVFKLCKLLSAGMQSNVAELAVNALLCVIVPNFIFYVIYSLKSEYRTYMKEIVSKLGIFVRKK